MREIDKLVTEYTKLKSEISTRKEKIEVIRESIANYMHRHKTNKLIATGFDDVLFKCTYQSRTRKTVDYVVLSEIVSNTEDYNRIVKPTTSESLIIRKAPKSAKKSKTNISPVQMEISENINVPAGNLS